MPCHIYIYIFICNIQHIVLITQKSIPIRSRAALYSIYYIAIYLALYILVHTGMRCHTSHCRLPANVSDISYSTIYIV